MTLRTALWTLAALLLATTAVFLSFQRQLTGSWLAFGVHPDVLAALDQSLEDQKRLAILDPESRGAYRERFGELETLRGRLRILEQSRERIRRRYGLLLLALLGAVVGVAGGVSVMRQRRDEARLHRLRRALEELSAGHRDLRLGERRGDLIGRIAGMIEETSRVMARDRRRLETLENLSAWQEAARRHAHEMRTPLTAARLAADRIRELAARGMTSGEEGRNEAVEKAAAGLSRELERLAAFTRGFAAFARLPRPIRVRHNLTILAAEFVETFASAWPGIELQLETPPAGEDLEVEVDRDLLRQVLVNLTDNFQRALEPSGAGGRLTLRLGGRPGSVHLDVADDGPGLPAQVVDRLFEPYVTTRRPGEGMGLGLAISKKILLDHGGDLELAETSVAGTTFRLILPRPEDAEPGRQWTWKREEANP